jgi:hypothetical protein
VGPLLAGKRGAEGRASVSYKFEFYHNEKFPLAKPFLCGQEIVSF